MFSLSELKVVVTIIGNLARMAVQNLVRVAIRDVRRNLCLASAASATHAHHLVPVLFGENRRGGATKRLPANYHREFHRLLHYMLRGAGLPGGNVSRKEYEALFKSNPATRKAAHTVLIQATKIFDKACSKKIGFKITPLVKKQIKQGKWDF